MGLRLEESDVQGKKKKGLQVGILGGKLPERSTRYDAVAPAALSPAVLRNKQEDQSPRERWLNQVIEYYIVWSIV